ncbi:MAG TPA: S16 family serine protease, partial [Vicinamibacteria bacterium]
TFRDNYLGVPFDLSNVLFIATANQLDPIQPAFLDRMEVIELSGYTEEEKVQIAKRHLIPKQVAENGLDTSRIAFSDEALKAVIGQYTREAGLRSFERQISRIGRKVARRVADGRESLTRITASNVSVFLGAPKFLGEDALQKDQVGVATGLAWTPTGGDVLFVEATVMKGKGELILTGTLGDVMQESARAALSYARSRAVEFHIDESLFSNRDIHVHIPEGAIPKDGPSAGVTMALAMISALTETPVRHNVALTGEITLRGNVLPVGGIKEKILAARRAKLRTVVVPKLNEKDLDELPTYVRRDLDFRLVEHVDEALKTSLADDGKILSLRAPEPRLKPRPSSSRSPRTALK